MLIIDSFGHNIYVNDVLVGYITDNKLMMNKKVFATITDDGIISVGDNEIGFVDDDGSIIINDQEVGYINSNNDFIFHKPISISK